MTPAALALEAVRLKEVARAGWLRVGIDAPESVAAHAWGVGFLALLLCPPGLDRGKVLAMAILHDLAEIDTGDITPLDGVSKTEKHRREALAMDRLLGEHPHLRGLWDEAEARVTPEARFLKELDTLEMGVQARRYAQQGGDVSTFLAAAAATLAGLDAAVGAVAVLPGADRPVDRGGSAPG